MNRATQSHGSKWLHPLLALFAITSLSSCTAIPSGIQPIDNFKPNDYMGLWYEIARIDNSFERGLSKVTANYSLNPDGTIKVVNKGYDAAEQQWQQAQGKAKFVQQNNIAHLKVSFFGPFYASYIVVDSDETHSEYAIVSGHNRNYLWLLARQPEVSNSIKNSFEQFMQQQAYPSKDLIWVEH